MADETGMQRRLAHVIIIDLGDDRVSARGGEARWLTRGATASGGGDGEGFAVGDDGYAEGWRDRDGTRQRFNERCNLMQRASLPAAHARASTGRASPTWLLCLRWLRAHRSFCTVSAQTCKSARPAAC